jgi:hypothetical protein
MAKDPYQILFTFNTLEVNLPMEFNILSDRPRFIETHQVKCILEGSDYNPKNICVHGDFLERDGYLNNYFGFANQKKVKKFRITNPHRSIKIWFTDMDGNEIPVTKEAPVPPSPTGYITSFMVEMVLVC